MNANRFHPSPCLAHRFPGCGIAMAAALPLLLALSSLASAQSTNTQGRPDFSSFKLVSERNIFDSRRSPRSAPRPTRTETRRPARVEYVTLVGIMDYDAQGPIAFFDGSSSQYQKVAKPADTIAGYKIAAIEPAQVRLAVGSNEFALPIGMQLRRDSEGKWQVAQPADAPSDRSDRSSFTRTAPPLPPPGGLPPGGPPPAGTNTDFQADAESLLALIDGQSETAATNAPPEAASGPGDADAVLQRLMQRRAQEANQ